MWLAVLSGRLVMHSALPLLTVNTLCDNGALLRLLRHSWYVLKMSGDGGHHMYNL